MGFTKSASFPLISRQTIKDFDSMQSFANTVVERINTDARKLNATLAALENVTGSTIVIGGNAYTLFKINEDGQLEGKFNPLPGSTISGGVIDEGTIIANKLTENSKGFLSSIVFSATDYDTVAWASGNITFSDNTAYAIDAGNTGNMTLLTYVYFDANVSKTTLQVTTDPATALGENKRLMCVAKKATNTSSDAFFVPAVGVFGVTDINIAANSISTASLQTGSVIAAKISVAQLSAITVDLGTITAGSITSAQYRTSTGTKRVEINYSTADEMIFYEGGSAIVRIGSSVHLSFPGVNITGGTLALISSDIEHEPATTATIAYQLYPISVSYPTFRLAGDGTMTWGDGSSPSHDVILYRSGADFLKTNDTFIAYQVESTVTTGTAPFVVASTTVVSGLNADLLDGNEATAFAAASHQHAGTDITSGDIDSARMSTNAVVLTGNQTVAGVKDFTSGIRIQTGVTLNAMSAVNSISPTSPNRTITVVINGTTYYIHAKTTND